MKRIELTQGMFAIVDEEDFEKINSLKWCYEKHGKQDYANKAIRVGKKQRSVRMHQMILNCPQGYEIDHINGCGLDNQRKNLRIVNRMQNNWNSRKRRKATSRYKGVSFSKRDKKWKVQILSDSRYYSMGLFETEMGAALAYNDLAFKLRGEYARLNNIYGHNRKN